MTVNCRFTFGLVEATLSKGDVWGVGWVGG